MLLALISNRSFSISAEVFLILALLLIPIAQYFQGIIYFSGDVWIVSFYLIAFALAFSVGLNFHKFGLEYVLSVLSVLFVVASVISIWIALRQAFSLSGSIWVVDLPFGGRPFANMAQPNNLATLCCLGVAGVYYLYERGFLGAAVSVFLSLFVLFGVALTQSRTPVVAFSLLLFFLYIKSSVGLVRARFWIFPALMCAYGLFLFLLYQFGQVLVDLGFLGFLAFSDISGFQSRASSFERLDMWSQLLYAAKNGGFWGYGWGQVSVAQIYASIDKPVGMMTAYSHNLIIDLFIWNGVILGSIIVLALALWFMFAIVRVRTVEGCFCFMVIGFIGVHAMFEFPLAYAFFLLPFGIFLGLLKREVFPGFELFVPRPYLSVVLIVSVAVFYTVWVEYRIIEQDNRQMRFEVVGLAQAGEHSVRSNSGLFNQLSSYISFARTPAAEGMDDDALSAMRKIAYRYPYASSLFRYSLALALNGRAEVAREQMFILRALHGEEKFEAGVRGFEEMQSDYPQLQEVLLLLSE